MRAAIGVWILVVVVTVVASGYLEGCFAAPATERPPAASFDLVRLDGVPVRLADQAGKALILDFWATWCAPCKVQMPILEELWARRGGEQLMILGVSMDMDPPDEVSAWLAGNGITYPIAIADMQLAADYGVYSFPTLIVIDPAGRIVRAHQGVLSRPELDAILDELESEFPPAS